MRPVEHDVDRFLTLLRNKIRERGFTQLEVQEALGWGRSYISQLLTKQKALRVEQMLLILRVINVDPTEFLGELYGPAHFGGGYAMPADPGFAKLRQQLHGLVDLLLEKQLISSEDLSAAVANAGREAD